MTDKDKDGGSNSGTQGSGSDQTGAGADGVKNKTVKMTMDQALAELEQEKQKNKEKDSLITDLTNQLKEANDALEAQQKSKLISEIMARSTFKMDELVNKSLEDLKNIQATLYQATLPKLNNARCGLMRADLSDREKGLTVGDLSFATQQKRKAARGAA